MQYEFTEIGSQSMDCISAVQERIHCTCLEIYECNRSLGFMKDGDSLTRLTDIS